MLVVRRFSVAALAAELEESSLLVDCFFRLLLARFLGLGRAAPDAIVPGCCCIVATDEACVVAATLILRLLVGFARLLPFLAARDVAEGENRSGGMLWALALTLAVAAAADESVLRDAGALDAGAETATLWSCSTSLPPLPRRDDRRTLVLVVC